MSPRKEGPLVVVGDALLDADLTGRAGRLAPDAPVPVLDDLEEVRRPGGAALAAALAAGEGRFDGGVVLVAPIADDAEGRVLADLVRDHGVHLVPIPVKGTTPVKRRVRAGGQSLLRLDSGETGAVGAVPPEALRLLGSARGILVADYGRGATSHPVLRAELERAATTTPIVWDPHPRGGTPVRGVRLVTPNSAEAQVFSGDSGTGLAAVTRQAARMVQQWEVHAVAVTLGSRGALLSHGESSPSVVPAPTVRAGDVCGAGDRFAAAAAVALSCGAVTLEAVDEAVRAASAFVADGGAAGFSAGSSERTRSRGAVERVRAAGGTVVATGGCFDLLHAGHVATLEAARRLGDCLVVCLNSDASVRRLKGPSRPLVPQDDRKRVLEALGCVDEVVIFDEDTPVEALRRLRPDVWAKGGDYAGAELPEAALLREWGGQSVVLPYLEGRSTTRLVTQAADQVGT